MCRRAAVGKSKFQVESSGRAGNSARAVRSAKPVLYKSSPSFAPILGSEVGGGAVVAGGALGTTGGCGAPGATAGAAGGADGVLLAMSVAMAGTAKT